MPRFGSHLSVAGGLHKAVAAATELGLESLQIFTKNASQWNGKILTEEAVETFRNAVEESNLTCVTAHDSYLINLASPDEGLYRRSIEAFVDEMERAERLGLDYLVTHPGAHLGTGEEAGIVRIAAAFDEILDRCADFNVMPLLETTAGQGTTIGHRFEHLGEILDRIGHPDRVGICFDTCHVFAAGYALGTAQEYRQTWKEFDQKVGINRVKAFHINDSRKPFGSRVDRHAHIGEGEMSIEPFQRLIPDRRFRTVPMILETPKEDRDGVPMDRINLDRLRECLGRKREKP